MNRTSFFLAASGATALGFSVSRDAHAMGPVDVEIGAIVGAGTTPTNKGHAALIGGDAVPAPNSLGVGLGGRAGVGLRGLYVGVEGMYYFGSSTGSPNNVQTSSDLLGVDVGYSFKLPLVTIRPLVGIGNFTERTNGLPLPGLPAGATGGPEASSSRSDNTLYVQPGITALLPLGTLYIGADANLLVLTSHPETTGGSAGNESLLALTIHAQLGAHF